MTGSKLDEFLAGVHGSGTCQGCHGGAEDHHFETMVQAHEGLVHDPSAVGACDGCHAEIAAASANSLHTNLWGEKKLIETRGQCTFVGSGHEADFNQKCGGCHTTCGQCHISRPNSAGGGFPKTFTYLSHSVQRSPHMTEQCTACHGSRVGNDYQGLSEGVDADLHYSHGRQCQFCHTAEEIHGDDQHAGDHYEHRYEVATMPRCENCHDTNDANFSNSWHDMHVNGFAADANLQCQVCHSQPYKNCTNCHNLDPDAATRKFEIDPSTVQFKIAKNPRTDYRGEYDYVVVRHVPVAPGTYEDWGLALPGYLDEPTWKYASPHNIKLRTEQTSGATCSSNCHDTPATTNGIFLRRIDLLAADGVTELPDYDANIELVVDDQ